MNHIYFTALVDGAGLAAEIAAELAQGDPVPRVYCVEPTGPFENDPNVTDKKFPGNPTRSYRSRAPLRVLGEVTDSTRLAPEALQDWRARLTASSQTSAPRSSTDALRPPAVAKGSTSSPRRGPLENVRF